MKARLTMRAALALGLPAVARGLGRLRRWHRDLLARAGHEAGRGNVLTAAGLLLLYALA
ncbi:hypothetical protein J2X36_004638 [Methylobacterium sp. BE186]|uniref:hypothetical protein n=1 Tax=Methylobacterium sp. BE186 TaxID=2817715 RepID=UPI002860A5B8|nr:hypothetical protein [Methylobacterium sp. BE186]MDR7039860.1 hypothetical protein [Methylobacterium sp. BE186]